jgi:hypothetical protein
MIIATLDFPGDGIHDMQFVPKSELDRVLEVLREIELIASEPKALQPENEERFHYYQLRRIQCKARAVLEAMG